MTENMGNLKLNTVYKLAWVKGKTIPYALLNAEGVVLSDHISSMLFPLDKLGNRSLKCNVWLDTPKGAHAYITLPNMQSIHWQPMYELGFKIVIVGDELRLAFVGMAETVGVSAYGTE